MSNKEEEEENVKPQRYRFHEGERILCFHGPLIYEAKCLKLRKSSTGTCEYLVHYAGWNKSWDEWTNDTRILKYNEQNLTRQKDLLKAHKDAKRLKGKGAPPGINDTLITSSANSSGSSLNSLEKYETNNKTASLNDETPVKNAGSEIIENDNDNSNNQDSASDDGSSTASKRKKRCLDPTVETEEHFVSRVEIKIKMPDELKPWLVDDWDLICRQRKIISLPVKTNVDDIIEGYIKYKTSNKNGAAANKENAAIQTANGIKEYFNATLGTKLLYRSERVQYSEILEKFPDAPMSTIYGAPHLLRLFVILGSLIVYTPIDERTVQVLQTHLHDFLKYLQKQMTTIFSLQCYTYTTAEYQRKLMQS